MTEQKINPANSLDIIPENFRPMSAAVLRLEVPERAGFHRHWFRGTAERIARAQQAGYRFVDERMVRINNFDLAGSEQASGSSDMGSRVSVISGEDADASGQPSRLYLMECPLEYYEKGQEVLGLQNDQIARVLGGGGLRDPGETEQDFASRYSKLNVPDLFKKKT